MTQQSGMLPTGGVAPRPARRRWLRIWLLLALIAASLWLLVSLGLAGWHAKQANAALSQMTADITADDPTAAASSIESARSNTQAARSAVTSLPIAALKVVPYFRTNLNGADAFLGAVLHVLDAADVTTEIYPQISGTGAKATAIVHNGRIDVAALEDTAPQVRQASEDLSLASQSLDQVPADISPVLRGVVDKAAPDIHRLDKALRMYNKVLPELPTLLGENQPATYLVVFHNPGELYAGGGAALNMALLQFKQGKMRVIDRGDVVHFFPLAQRVPWNPVAQGPYYATKGARDGFAWSNLHQDFRVAGEDMMRSWVANGGPPVDGIISLDPVALAAAVSSTGPIESTLYGRITADNLVQKLLIDGYSSGATLLERHAVNQQLIDEMLARMEQSDVALTAGRAMLATAPGQHLRIHLSDNRLADALNEAEVDGAQPGSQPDRIAFFTQNQNASKVDVFQSRRVIHDVNLESDGSATVVQTAKVTNQTPETKPTSARTGYHTRWAFHWNIVLLPEAARDVKLAANPGEIRKDKQVYTDVDGRKVVRVGRWIPPGGSSYITVSYRLPAGTFGQDGVLQYRVGVEHQPTIEDTDLTVNVSGPSKPTPLDGVWDVHDGGASSHFPISRPTTLSLGFGSD